VDSSAREEEFRQAMDASGRDEDARGRGVGFCFGSIGGTKAPTTVPVAGALTKLRSRVRRGAKSQNIDTT
jgi:hypothetical protein